MNMFESLVYWTQHAPIWQLVLLMVVMLMLAVVLMFQRPRKRRKHYRRLS